MAYVEAADRATLTVNMTCGSSGSPVPVDYDLLAGLTVYGESFGQDEIAAPDESALFANPGGTRRKIIEDPNAELYDFEVQALRVAGDSRGVTLSFEASAEALADKPFMLFALWKAETKEICDPDNRYERQGCKDHGYVVGQDLVNALVMAYPALIWVQTDFGEEMANYEVPRWVVERYR